MAACVVRRRWMRGERRAAAACMASNCCTRPTMPLSIRSRDGEGGNTSTTDGGVHGRGDGGYEVSGEAEKEEREEVEAVETVEAVEELRLCSRLERVDLAGGRKREVEGEYEEAELGDVQEEVGSVSSEILAGMDAEMGEEEEEEENEDGEEEEEVADGEDETDETDGERNP